MASEIPWSQEYPFTGISSDSKEDKGIHLGGCMGACMTVASAKKGYIRGPRRADNEAVEALWSELYVYVDKLV